MYVVKINFRFLIMSQESDNMYQLFINNKNTINRKYKIEELAK